MIKYIYAYSLCVVGLFVLVCLFVCGSVLDAKTRQRRSGLQEWLREVTPLFYTVPCELTNFLLPIPHAALPSVPCTFDSQGNDCCLSTGFITDWRNHGILGGADRCSSAVPVKCTLANLCLFWRSNYIYSVCFCSIFVCRELYIWCACVRACIWMRARARVCVCARARVCMRIIDPSWFPSVLHTESK